MGGRLAGTTLHPPELEAEFRASTLRDDGRTAAIVVGVFTLLSLPFIANDLVWAAPAGRLREAIVARIVYAASGLLVVLLGLRARRPVTLDLAILVNEFLAGGFMLVIQSTRPADYYLPVMDNVLGVLLLLTVIPNRFSFQVLAALAMTGSAAAWIALFRDRPPPPVERFIGFTFAVAFLAGAFVSWKLHRSRRLQFLALREQAAGTRRLAESEALFRTAFDNASIGKVLSDTSGRFLRVNEALCQMLGYRAEELLGRGIGEVTHPEDVEKSHRVARELLDGAPHQRLSKRYLRKDGATVWAEVGVSLLRDQEGRPLHFITGILDVTDLRRAQEALSVSLSRYAELYAGLGDGIVSVEPDGTIVEFNDAYARMLGYPAEELRGMNYAQVTPERWHGVESGILADLYLRQGRTVTYDKEYRRKDGTVFPIEIRAFIEYADGRPARLWGIVRDITEARALREQLAIASRLAAMGTLVAGVAHEINNPLGGAIASHGFASEEVQQVRDVLRSGGPLDRDGLALRLDAVVDAIGDATEGEQRVAAIVKDLTLLGRPDVRRARVSLAQVVEESMRWVPAPVRQRAIVEVQDDGAPEVAASPGQMAQVVANLVTNAVRAALEGRPARVRIRFGPGAPGHARLEVADDGAGMTPEVMRHMFDPFFTTRDVGQGMGLGLAICHAIVTAHGGTISATSEPGHGSTFRVELPMAT